MATGAQPAHAQKRCSRLTGLCGALMERQVFRRKDVFSGTHWPFVFIPHRSKPLALSLLSPSPANRLFSSLSSAWEGVFFFLTCPPEGLQKRPQLEPAKTLVGLHSRPPPPELGAVTITPTCGAPGRVGAVPKHWQLDLLDVLPASLSLPSELSSACRWSGFLDYKPALDPPIARLACRQEDRAQTSQCDPQPWGSGPASLSSHLPKVPPPGSSLLECFSCFLFFLPRTQASPAPSSGCLVPIQQNSAYTTSSTKPSVISQALSPCVSTEPDMSPVSHSTSYSATAVQ